MSISALTGFLVALSVMLSHQVSAQGVVGNEKAHNWQDKEFAPDIKNEAIHLRSGRGGINVGNCPESPHGNHKGEPLVRFILSVLHQKG